MAYPYTWDHDASFVVDGGYCLPEDVQAIFKNVGSYSTLDVMEFTRRVAEASVEIDIRLSPNYIVPIVGDPAALQLLRIICSRLAAAIIHEVYYRQAQKGAPIPGEMWRKYAEDLLASICDGSITFFLAPLQPGGESPQFPTGKGATFNSEDDADVHTGKLPLFQRGGRGRSASLGDLI